MHQQTNKQDLHLAYKRVSTTDQTTQRQLEGLTFNREYEDKASAKDTDRPELQRLLADLDVFSQIGNVTLHIHSLDRLARNLSDLEGLIKDITAKGVEVKFHKEGLVFNAGAATPMQTLMLQMLGAVAQFERSLIKERQAEGIAVAKQKGVYKGRKPSLSDSQIKDLESLIAAGTSKTEAAKKLGVSRATVYNYLSQD